MGSLVSCLAAGAAWCFCSAAGSLLASCCGNDKAGDVPPSATSGRKRSVLLLIIAIGIALIFQYAVGPRVATITVSNYVTDSWKDGCEDFATKSLEERCVGNNGVYRAMGSALVFFLLAAIAAFFKPTANREAWPAKYILYVFLALGTCFIPNSPLFSDVYLQLARVCGVIFIIIQQVIILDIAWNWNESWVEKSNKAESDTMSQRWLGAIIFSSILLFVGSLTSIGLLFGFFGGCTTNVAFISITLVLSLVVTVVQLMSEEGSLLSSAVIMSYATYLCYTAVSKNPNDGCNPVLGHQDLLGIVLGILITMVSLGWAGWSLTAEQTVGGQTDLQENLVDEENQEKQKDESEDRDVKGVVANSIDRDNKNEEAKPDEEKPKPVSWRINLILAFVSCWIAMSLTGWGSISSGGDIANPSVGEVSMWMVIAAQWIVFALYTWSLLAPRLFPDRDFS